MGVAQILEQHPLISVFSVGAVVASASVGSSAFFFNKQVEIEQKRHDLQLEQTTAELKQTISDLSRRITSVERRIGGAEEFLNLARMLVNETELPSLPGNFTSFLNGKVLIDLPKMAQWEKSESNELDLLGLGPRQHVIDQTKNVLEKFESLGLGENPVVVASREVFKTVGEFPVLLWRSTENLEFTTSLVEEDATAEFSLPAYVAIQELPTGYFEKKLAVALPLLQAALRGDAGSDLENEGAAGKDFTNVQKELADASSESIAVDLQEIDEFVDRAGSLLDANQAAFYLIDFVTTNLQVAQVNGADFKILSAQQKLNAMYIRSQFSFVESAEHDKICGGTVYVDQELFYIGAGEAAFVAHVSIPSCERRGSAYDWASQWLSGMRVVAPI